MTHEEAARIVQDIFKDIFDDHTLLIHGGMSANDIDNWDSLNHVNLLSAIQKEFKIKFELHEVYRLNNVDAIIDLILKKTNS